MKQLPERGNEMKTAENKSRNRRKAVLAAPANDSWNAVKVKLGNGFTYLVTRISIENDLAATIMDSEGVTNGVAMERARSQNVYSWYNEQYGIDDVLAQGVVLARPTYEEAMQLAFNANATQTIESSEAVNL